MDAEALADALRSCDVVKTEDHRENRDAVEVEHSEHHSPWVRFDIPDGRIPPEISEVLADHDATLFDGCLTNGYHEFRARGVY